MSNKWKIKVNNSGLGQMRQQLALERDKSSFIITMLIKYGLGYLKSANMKIKELCHFCSIVSVAERWTLVVTVFLWNTLIKLMYKVKL